MIFANIADINASAPTAVFRGIFFSLQVVYYGPSSGCAKKGRAPFSTVGLGDGPYRCLSATCRVERPHGTDRLRPHDKGRMRVLHGGGGAPRVGRHDRRPADPRGRTGVAPLPCRRSLACPQKGSRALVRPFPTVPPCGDGSVRRSRHDARLEGQHLSIPRAVLGPAGPLRPPVQAIDIAAIRVVAKVAPARCGQAVSVEPCVVIRVTIKRVVVEARGARILVPSPLV